MSLLLLDGKVLAQKITNNLKKEVTSFANQYGTKPCLAVILVGNNPASRIYVNRKKEEASSIGFEFQEYPLPSNLSHQDLKNLIIQLNQNSKIHGILIQLPLPNHLNSNLLLQSVDPRKDVDGFHCLNMGRLALGFPHFVPCTPLGIFELLSHFSIKVSGKHVVILGRSAIVGRPMALLFIQNHANATVTICHSHTENLSQIIATADILIVAIGKTHFIDSKYFHPAQKKKVVVVDVGIHKVEDPSSTKGYRLVGDVDFDSVAPLCQAITPVPGGVGPMTIAMLLKNTLSAAQNLLSSHNVSFQS